MKHYTSIYYEANNVRKDSSQNVSWYNVDISSRTFRTEWKFIKPGVSFCESQLTD